MRPFSSVSNLHVCTEHTASICTTRVAILLVFCRLPTVSWVSVLLTHPCRLQASLSLSKGARSESRSPIGGLTGLGAFSIGRSMTPFYHGNALEREMREEVQRIAPYTQYSIIFIYIVYCKMYSTIYYCTVYMVLGGCTMIILITTNVCTLLGYSWVGFHRNLRCIFFSSGRIWDFCEYFRKHLHDVTGSKYFWQRALCLHFAIIKGNINGMYKNKGLD